MNIKLLMGLLLSIFSVIAVAGSQVGQIYIGDTINNESLIIPSGIIQSPPISSARAVSSATAGGAAPGISYYQVYAVGSSNVPNWEYISPSQTTTVSNHGGAQLSVVTFQYGYGNANAATLNATPGIHYLRQYLCGPFSAPYICNVGGTITGYLDYFSFNGLQSGYYTSSASSVASPYGTWTDSIYVQ